MKTRLILWGLILCLFAACQPSKPVKEKEDDFQADSPLFYEGLMKLDKGMANRDYIVIIPGSGCGGCIGQATDFFLNYEKSLQIDWAVVFTGVMDKKQLKINVGDRFLELPNVWIDEDNVLRVEEISSIYTLLIDIEQEKIKSVGIFDALLFEEMIAGEST